MRAEWMAASIIQPPEAFNLLKRRPETGMYAAGIIHFQVPGLGRQDSGSGVQHQVQVQDPYPHPHLKTRT